MRCTRHACAPTTPAVADGAPRAGLQLHPQPFTVRLALGLDAKNPVRRVVQLVCMYVCVCVNFLLRHQAFVLPAADIAVAAKECALGALSFCGQVRVGARRRRARAGPTRT